MAFAPWSLLGALAVFQGAAPAAGLVSMSQEMLEEGRSLLALEEAFQDARKGTRPLMTELAYRPEESLYDMDHFANVGTSGILVVQVLWQNKNSSTRNMGEEGEYPNWAVKCLGNTAEVVAHHGHSLVVRQGRTGNRSKYEKEICAKAETEKGCAQGYRNAATWEKFYMLLQYLESPKMHYSHIMYLDVDETFAQFDRDTVGDLARLMDAHGPRGASLLAADMDWDLRWGGFGHANTGMLMAKNTPYAKALLRALVAAHEDPKASGWGCWMNEQICLQGFARGSFPFEKRLPRGPEFAGPREDHLLAVSGSRYGRHPDYPCTLRNGDPDCRMDDVDLIHFMGMAKGYAVNGRLLPRGLFKGEKPYNSTGREVWVRRNSTSGFRTLFDKRFLAGNR